MCVIIFVQKKAVFLLIKHPTRINSPTELQLQWSVIERPILCMFVENDCGFESDPNPYPTTNKLYLAVFLLTCPDETTFPSLTISFSCGVIISNLLKLFLLLLLWYYYYYYYQTPTIHSCERTYASIEFNKSAENLFFLSFQLLKCQLHYDIKKI